MPSFYLYFCPATKDTKNAPNISFWQFSVCGQNDVFFLYFCPETKVPKVLPLNRRDGSVEVMLITNLLALTTNGGGEASLQIRHFVGFRYADKMTKLLSGFPDPPLTSLLRRGRLTSLFFYCSAKCFYCVTMKFSATNKRSKRQYSCLIH